MANRKSEFIKKNKKKDTKSFDISKYLVSLCMLKLTVTKKGFDVRLKVTFKSVKKVIRFIIKIIV
jgi:hypothetical protein